LRNILKTIRHLPPLPHIQGSPKKLDLKFLTKLKASFSPKKETVQTYNQGVYNEQVEAERIRIQEEKERIENEEREIRKRFKKKILAAVGGVLLLSTTAYLSYKVIDTRSKIAELAKLDVKPSCSAFCSNNELETSAIEDLSENHFVFRSNEAGLNLTLSPTSDFEKALKIIHGDDSEIRFFSEPDDSANSGKSAHQILVYKDLVSRQFCLDDSDLLWRVDRGEVKHSLNTPERKDRLCSIASQLEVLKIKLPEGVNLDNKYSLTEAIIDFFGDDAFDFSSGLNPGETSFQPKPNLHIALKLVHGEKLKIQSSFKFDKTSTEGNRLNAKFLKAKYITTEFLCSDYARPSWSLSGFSNPSYSLESQNGRVDICTSHDLVSAKNSFINHLNESSVDFSEERIKGFDTLRRLEQEAINLFPQKAILATSQGSEANISTSPFSPLMKALESIYPHSDRITIGLADNYSDTSDDQHGSFPTTIARNLTQICSDDYKIDLVVYPHGKKKANFHLLTTGIKKILKCN